MKLVQTLAGLAFALLVAQCDGDYLTCPQFWHLYGHKCYRFFGERVTFDTATARCRSYFSSRGQGELVEIEGSAENAYVYKLFRSSVGPTLRVSTQFTFEFFGAWIGLQKSADGTWSWSNGRALSYSNWQEGQPSNSGGNEDCAHVGLTTTDYVEQSGWNDMPCNRNLPYVCMLHQNKIACN